MSAEETIAGRQRAEPWWRSRLAVPTGRMFALTLLPMVASLGVLASPTVAVPILAFDLVMALVALGDLAMSWGGRVAVTRSWHPVQAVGQPFEVGVVLRNEGRSGLRLRATDAAPGDTDGLPWQGEVEAGGEVRITYAATVDRRGQHPFGDLTVRWSSPLGLWERQRRYATDGVVRVYPDFARLRETGLRGRLSERKAPGGARRRPGGENEFERLRPYVPGDPYRHIDWKATARRQQYVTREFGQESNQNLILLVDSGRMMSARSGGLTAFDHALNAAVLLGQVALRHGDRVGLLVFDTKVRAWLPPKGGARTADRLIRATYDLQPSMDEPDYAAAFRHLHAAVRRRSLVVLFTSVVDQVNADLASGLVRALRSRHLAVAVWMRDVDVDALLDEPATDPSGSYARAAAAELSTWRERALADLQRQGALVLDAPPADLTRGLLHRYLEIKARRLL
ncbi:MAG: DUF58 domain-containing protein [Alphaproteobacteria bacterium]|nr:DUF58 domain-containing protein [Alphaproteobacteria bacterium]